MACEDFLYFYQALPVTILTAISIFGVFYIYAMQQRDSEQKNIKNSINNFKKSLSDFSDITYNVSYLLIPHGRSEQNHERQQSEGLEVLNISYEKLVTLENQLINNNNIYDAYKKGRNNQSQSYKNVLYDFEFLQESIYDKFLYVADGFFEETYAEIDLIEVEKWIKKFIPFAKEIEGIKTGIPFHNKIVEIFKENQYDYNRRLHDDEIALLINFYRDFFKKFDNILKESLDIDDMIFKYYSNRFNAILSSHLSRVCLSIIPVIFLIFGLIIPLYMMQPLHLNWLSCQDVFLIVISFLILNIIPLLIAYVARHKPQSLIKISIVRYGASSNIGQLPINVIIFFRNTSRTPVSSLFVNSEIYVNDNKIFSKIDSLSLGPYSHQDLKIDFRNELERGQRDMPDILTKEIKLIIRYHYMSISIMNKIFLFKVEHKSTYLWNTASKEWKIKEE